jgi:hypothetical protein
MKKEYRKVNVVASRSFLAATLAPARSAGEQSPSYLGIASGYCPHNDIKLEP